MWESEIERKRESKTLWYNKLYSCYYCEQGIKECLKDEYTCIHTYVWKTFNQGG